MTDARSNSVPRRTRSRWTSFVGRYAKKDEPYAVWKRKEIRSTAYVWSTISTPCLFISPMKTLSGWTTLAIDRSTRGWAIAQRGSQLRAAEAAYASCCIGQTVITSF